MKELAEREQQGRRVVLNEQEHSGRRLDVGDEVRSVRKKYAEEEVVLYVPRQIHGGEQDELREVVEANLLHALSTQSLLHRS